LNKKVCLITPGHISTNPRLVKEAIALIKTGYRVHIVFTQYMNYLLKEDSRILKANPSITFDGLDWTDNSFESKFNRIASGFYQRICSALNKKVRRKLFQRAIINRNFQWQLKKAINAKADLYIAHNAGALAVAAEAAATTSVLFSFDAEDYHRAEALNTEMLEAVVSLEEYYLPDAAYISAASPLIAEEYASLYNKRVTTILNVFPKKMTSLSKRKDPDKLKLFWFSQKIGTGRGIEEILKAIGMVNDRSIELHLLGLHESAIVKNLQDKAEMDGIDSNQLFFYSPISPDFLLDFASQFDIGMATETGIPFNREICLTNKIFTYIQSGLAVIASNTKAQIQLLNEYPEAGRIYGKTDAHSLAKSIRYFLDNPGELEASKKSNSLLGIQKFNWEIESEIYLNCINNLSYNISLPGSFNQ
jgi:glycosyltransferase involved in cell wall biosynthesis